MERGGAISRLTIIAGVLAGCVLASAGCQKVDAGPTASAREPRARVTAGHTRPRPAAHRTPAGRDFYVDSLRGDDHNSGRGVTMAWRSLERAGRAALKPGDRLLLVRGGSWTGGLTLRASGTAARPLTLGAYGRGPRPEITGDCVTVTGARWVVESLRVTTCTWSGVELRGDHDVVRDLYSDHNIAGVLIPGSGRFNTVTGSTFDHNDRMSVNDGKNDSGAWGVLLNGDDNVVSHNTITGSLAASKRYGTDGAAVEVYDGSRNLVAYNTASGNDTFTELGRSPGHKAEGNTFAYNVVTGRGSFLVTRGAGDPDGPVTGTLAVGNSVALRGLGWSCYAGCSPELLRLRNNVMRVTGYVGQADGGGVDDAGGVYLGRLGFRLGPRSVRADPRFVSATDLRLRPGSPATGRAVRVEIPAPLPFDFGLPPVNSGAFPFL